MVDLAGKPDGKTPFEEMTLSEQLYAYESLSLRLGRSLGNLAKANVADFGIICEELGDLERIIFAAVPEAGGLLNNYLMLCIKRGNLEILTSTTAQEQLQFFVRVSAQVKEEIEMLGKGG